MLLILGLTDIKVEEEWFPQISFEQLIWLDLVATLVRVVVSIVCVECGGEVTDSGALWWMKPEEAGGKVLTASRTRWLKLSSLGRRS